MRDRLIEYQKETGNTIIWNLPRRKGLLTVWQKWTRKNIQRSSVLMRIMQNRGAEPFYTNSTQLPVNFTADIFEALDLQDDIQTKYTGGTVFHAFCR